MQQDIFSRQQELAQSYQLGMLEKEYTVDPRKFLANFGILLVVAILAPFLVFNLSHSATNSIVPIIFSLLFFIVVGGIILQSLYHYYMHLHVYAYTGGLLYLNENKSRVVYWQQMKKAYSNKGYLNIQVTNEIPLSIPVYLAGYAGLRERIKQEIASARNTR